MKRRRERKGGEKVEKRRKKKRRRKEMLHRESNLGPFTWKVKTLTVDHPRLLIACTYYTDIYHES